MKQHTLQLTKLSAILQSSHMPSSSEDSSANVATGWHSNTPGSMQTYRCSCFFTTESAVSPLNFCTHVLPVVPWSLSATPSKHSSSADLCSISPFPIPSPLPGTGSSCCSPSDAVLGKALLALAVGTMAESIGAAGEGAAVALESAAAMIEQIATNNERPRVKLYSEGRRYAWYLPVAFTPLNN